MKIRALVLTLLVAATSLILATPAQAVTTMYYKTMASGTFSGPSEGSKDVTRTSGFTYKVVRGPINVHWYVHARTTDAGIYRTKCTVTLTLSTYSGRTIFQTAGSANTPKLAGTTLSTYALSRSGSVKNIWLSASEARFQVSLLDHMYPEHIPGLDSSWWTGPNTFIIAGERANNDCTASITITS